MMKLGQRESINKLSKPMHLDRDLHHWVHHGRDSRCFWHVIPGARMRKKIIQSRMFEQHMPRQNLHTFNQSSTKQEIDQYRYCFEKVRHWWKWLRIPIYTLSQQSTWYQHRHWMEAYPGCNSVHACWLLGFAQLYKYRYISKLFKSEDQDTGEGHNWWFRTITADHLADLKFGEARGTGI